MSNLVIKKFNNSTNIKNIIMILNDVSDLKIKNVSLIMKLYSYPKTSLRSEAYKFYHKNIGSLMENLTELKNLFIKIETSLESVEFSKENDFYKPETLDFLKQLGFGDSDSENFSSSLLSLKKIFLDVSVDFNDVFTRILIELNEFENKLANSSSESENLPKELRNILIPLTNLTKNTFDKNFYERLGVIIAFLNSFSIAITSKKYNSNIYDLKIQVEMVNIISVMISIIGLSALFFVFKDCDSLLSLKNLEGSILAFSTILGVFGLNFFTRKKLRKAMIKFNETLEFLSKKLPLL